MKSRVHPTYKTKYRVRNWASYDQARVHRGDLTVWVSPAVVAAWEPAGVGTRGGQLRYSDLAIETALTLRLIFHLPLRQTEGFLTSIFGLMGLDLSAPDHTTLSRRGQFLDLALRRVPTSEGMHLIIDSTGLSIVGEGEWAALKYGGRGTRGWKKLHLGVRLEFPILSALHRGYAGVSLAVAAPSATGPARRGPLSRARPHGSVSRQVKQGEPEVLHARDRVGQTSGATQRDLKPGCSERIGNSRRTGVCAVHRSMEGMLHVALEQWQCARAI